MEKVLKEALALWEVVLQMCSWSPIPSTLWCNLPLKPLPKVQGIEKQQILNPLTIFSNLTWLITWSLSSSNSNCSIGSTNFFLSEGRESLTIYIYTHKCGRSGREKRLNFCIGLQLKGLFRMLMHEFQRQETWGALRSWIWLFFFE